MITFDVWNTLFIPNEYFSDQRNKFLSDYTEQSVEKVSKIYKETKEDLDGLHLLGEAYSSEACWEILIDRLMENHNARYDAQYARLRVEELFRKFPPSLTPNCEEALLFAKKKYKIVGVVSNTNFISGKIIKEFLPKNIFWNFWTFSDIVGVSKPDKRIWQLEYKKGKLIHVGDSKGYDGAVEQIGGKFLHYDGSVDILELIKKG